jgi:hypothetical protein
VLLGVFALEIVYAAVTLSAPSRPAAKRAQSPAHHAKMRTETRKIGRLPEGKSGVR